MLEAEAPRRTAVTKMRGPQPYVVGSETLMPALCRLFTQSGWTRTRSDASMYGAGRGATKTVNTVASTVATTKAIDRGGRVSRNG